MFARQDYFFLIFHEILSCFWLKTSIAAKFSFYNIFLSTFTIDSRVSLNINYIEICCSFDNQQSCWLFFNKLPTTCKAQSLQYLWFMSSLIETFKLISRILNLTIIWNHFPRQTICTERKCIFICLLLQLALTLQPANYNVLINISYFISHLVVLPAKIQIRWNIYIFNVKIIFSSRTHTDWAFLFLVDIENSTLEHMKMKYFHVIITTLCSNDSIVRKARRSHVSKHEWDLPLLAPHICTDIL